MKNKKTPEQWFMQLKEPYRSQAIANIDKESINKYYTSINKALCTSFVWSDSKQGDDYWVKISSSLEAGETTYLEPENVSLINEVNNTQVTEQQNQIESEKVETDWKAKFEELQKRYEVLVTESHKLDVLSGEMCDKYTELKAKYDQLQPKCEKVYFYFDNEDERWYYSKDQKEAVKKSIEDMYVFEAKSLGVKLSILVDEEP